MRDIDVRPIDILRRVRVGILAVAVGALALIGCASTGVNKGDFNLVSYQEEWQLGAQLERDIARQMQILNDPTTKAYVSRIGQRIVAQTELAQAPWKFHVVADPQINAFNIPGGHVYVNTGLICATDNVAELAGVMAHETAHGVARHGTEQLSRAYGVNVVASLLLGGNPAWYTQLVAQVAATGTFAKWSRDAEREADHLGIVYMYNAGYDPHGMATMFQELIERRQREPGALESFFSSHPLTEERIASVRAQIDQLPPRQDLVLRDGQMQSSQSRISRYCR
ncbi:MAG TPA: M48 family metallopeptidase [Gemmatimonadota bacterium]|nr:M48 family metallopeptidase [Gemmatimonadota bacterium]